MKILILSKKCLLFSCAAIVVVAVAGILVWQFAFKSHSSVRTGVVVTNGYQCASIGTSVLNDGGSAADAAVAVLFCEGISMPQSMGLGGGFLATIYNKQSHQIESLNARETAPGAATKDMYEGTSGSQRGGLAVAVPGELKGYWALHQKYGALPWRRLVEPTIELCKNGVYVTEFLANTYLSNKNVLYADPVLRDIFIDPNTNSTYQAGESVKRLRLAKSLEIIAEEGVDALYNTNGSLINTFVQDIRDSDGIITVDDMLNYEPKWEKPVSINISDDYTFYSVPLPGSGVVLAYILNILDGFLNREVLNTQAFQRIVESFKFGYGSRTKLGDIDASQLVSNLLSKSYAEEVRANISDVSTSQDPSFYGADSISVDDHGTAHISILAPNGDAVSVTSTINLVFGAGFASNSTGIILNDEMDDFSKPNSTDPTMPSSEPNFIEPGKRPLSSMVPTIILKGDDVVMVTGAAGGKKITTVVASIIIKHLWYSINIQDAVNHKRLHHQLFPMTLEVEDGFNNSWPGVINELQSYGHDVKYSASGNGFSAVTSISAINEITGAYDPRRGGYISYIYS
ncbi:hypothetical protein GWI33_014504 [Rhynchophorus ferrugineus]|uniref:Uncharacterized protein n=1 Tax=Rhynchophorus ferrugineus TaxID=354439 RepID=A0A834I4Y4_RHYFE|nr:hypothetical protein GWI33_014504 [Rhynchophorus ferrugineus]